MLSSHAQGGSTYAASYRAQELEIRLPSWSYSFSSSVPQYPPFYGALTTLRTKISGCGVDDVAVQNGVAGQTSSRADWRSCSAQHDGI
jgi:hypothetical protein